MAKLVYRNDEFPTVELVADDGEEVTAEQVSAWALFRLGDSIDCAANAIHHLAAEMPIH